MYMQYVIIMAFREGGQKGGVITKDASESSDWQTRVLKGEWYLRYGPLIRYCVNYENFITVYLGSDLYRQGDFCSSPAAVERV